MQQVRLGFRDASGDQWNARGDRGQLAQNSGIVSLSGNVHVDGCAARHRPSWPRSPPSTCAFDTKAQIVATHDPVTLVMSGRQLNAQGMVASLKERHVQLESAVHGSFVP